ncbi:hypothetical protein [Streptomyces sp. H27-D2]|uniref:hypothetical protein n=1 Tax=Streptomyces sp. H27-D2 TaxID=3046304 RepID=UPI002DBF03A1|nr:hypothetical protein [Streptomyces sp. H27-D2]MEC4016136.1 hypothetical protein [Streptomyces sp. H27-D2]
MRRTLAAALAVTALALSAGHAAADAGDLSAPVTAQDLAAGELRPDTGRTLGYVEGAGDQLGL